MPTYPTYKLGEICDILNGFAFKSSNYVSDGLRVIRITNVKKGYVIDEEPQFYPIETQEELKKYVLKKGDLLISLTGNVGRVGILNEELLPAALNQRVGCLRVKDKSLVCLQYLFHLFNTDSFEKDCINSSKGIAQKNMSTEWLKEYEIPLPPLATQRAIVTRIEALFAELDKGVEKLKTAQQQLKVYRQAVLNDAYDGNLTIEWRKNNHIDNNTWKEVTFAEIAEIKCNLVDVNDYGDFPHIAPDNIEKESGRLLEYHTVAEDGVISVKHRFFSGQILYSKIRPNLSKVVIADFDGLCSADMYPIEAKENTKFLFYQMLSSKFVDYASNSGSRTVLPKINQKSLSIIPMKVCTLPEQQRIVQEIETRLSACDEVEKNIAESLQQAEALRQSILKKAFSGELV